MSNIQIQCEDVSKTFSATLTANPKVAAVMLGNLYYFLPKQQEDEKKLIEKTIQGAKEKLTGKVIVDWWNMIDTLKECDWKAMPKDHKDTLCSLRQNMLRDSHYFQHLSHETLIKIGQNSYFTREALIALVRKELIKNKSVNPFKTDGFNYHFLKKGGAEENHPYLYPFLKKCTAVPIDAIVSLGKGNIKVAELILKDFSTATPFFAISAKLAEYHPSLRAAIARDWKNLSATHPLTPQEQKTVQEDLNRLKASYSEFKDVSLNTRVESVQPKGKEEAPLSVWNYVKASVSSGATLYGGLKAATLFVSPAILPHYMVVTGMMGVVGTGLGIVCHNQGINDREVKTKVSRFFGWF